MNKQAQAIIQECKNQAESCLYTSTSLFIWLRDARVFNRWLYGTQIAVGAIASSTVLLGYPTLAAIIAFLAGVLPSIYEKLNLSKHVEAIEFQAGQYKNLQDRFRQAANIVALDDDPGALKAEFATLMRQMEELRSKPVTAPEKCFLKAQAKIKAGHYDFDAENKSIPGSD